MLRAACGLEGGSEGVSDFATMACGESGWNGHGRRRRIWQSYEGDKRARVARQDGTVGLCASPSTAHRGASAQEPGAKAVGKKRWSGGFGDETVRASAASKRSKSSSLR